MTFLIFIVRVPVEVVDTSIAFNLTKYNPKVSQKKFHSTLMTILQSQQKQKIFENFFFALYFDFLVGHQQLCDP